MGFLWLLNFDIPAIFMNLSFNVSTLYVYTDIDMYRAVKCFWSSSIWFCYWLLIYIWFLFWYSAGSDLLARCEEDGSGLWLDVVCPSVTLLFLCPERAGLSLPGCPNCHPQLQDLQECPAGRSEVRRGPPLQVSGPPLPVKWTWLWECKRGLQRTRAVLNVLLNCLALEKKH